MSNTSRIAFAVLAGYYLGRRRKLRMAAALALAGLVGRARMSEGGGLLSQGIKTLRSSAEVGQITDRLRGDLMEVGKAAAVAATSRQIDALSNRLHERAETLRTQGTAKGPRRTTREAEEEGPEEEGPEEEGPEEDYEDRHYEDEGEGYEEEPEPPPQRTQRRTRPVRRAGQSRR
ncbi:hypothetical protein [Nonomuraea sp. NPDC049784]|uniref:hypothetical protein n=1 Tax=Nonomuraea sp. NPDC049784 TaxID=3154361 RepID=UPI0033D3D2E5